MSKTKTRLLPPQDLSVFCDQVAMVLKAGIPLHDAMETLCENYRGTSFGARFEKINGLLKKNGALCESLTEAGIFPEYMLGMVRVGESSGRLDEVMTSLSAYYSREARIRSAIRSAVAYPMLLTAMMALVIAVLLISVIPVFERVYASLGMDISSSSVGAGIILGRVVLIMIGVLILALVIVMLLLRSSAKDSVTGTLEKLVPAIRNINRATFASRFASVISTMLLSGGDTDEAVEMAQYVVTNSRSREKTALCLSALKDGKSFPEAVEQAGIFDPLYEKMIAIGVRSGSLDTLMGRLAATYDDISARGVRRLISSIEPTLVVLLCVAIGGILLSVMLPLLSLLAGIA